jgi:hypothetical protein
MSVRVLVSGLAILALTPNAYSQSQTPLTGHYPPGQSGLRGASTPEPGWAYTNFSRFFTNLEVVDAGGDQVQNVDELRYANISMITWTTNFRFLGMSYGALAGIPFATGNLRPSAEDTASSDFGLGDILITPVSLYGKSAAFDYQFQFTVWTASGRYSPGAPDNRGTGFWALVYSLGGVYYPGGVREAWSLSAVARIEQNFEQTETGVIPGDDIVVDWGVGRIVRAGGHAIDVGVSGFGAWQLTAQKGGAAGVDADRYRFFGIGPEASTMLTKRIACRLRAHWEFGAHNVIRGNNLWIIFNYKW